MIREVQGHSCAINIKWCPHTADVGRLHFWSLARNYTTHKWVLGPGTLLSSTCSVALIIKQDERQQVRARRLTLYNGTSKGIALSSSISVVTSARVRNKSGQSVMQQLGGNESSICSSMACMPEAGLRGAFCATAQAASGKENSRCILLRHKKESLHAARW